MGHSTVGNIIKLENVAISNASQLEVARATPPFYGFNYHAMPSLKLRNISTAVLQRFCCWYITLRCDLNLWPRNLDLWPLTLNICSVSRVTLQNSVPNLNAIEQSVAELLLFSVWPYDLEHCVTCFARLWDNVHQV